MRRPIRPSPPGGESTNFAATPVPATQFVDGGWSTLARILPFMEGGAMFNGMNFVAAYNEASGMNFTATATVVDVFLCPSSVHMSGQRDQGDPTDPLARLYGSGYGYNDYGPTVYTDIDPLGLPFPGAPEATPYRNKATRANGLLKQGKTTIAEATDGTSNTIAIGEDAGRDERFLSPYAELSANGGDPRGLGPAGSTTSPKRYWRWAEPDLGYGVSGQPNNKFRPSNETTPWQTGSGTLGTAGNNAGANDELSSFHPGGVNCLFGDGSVKFIKDSINMVTLRGLVTLSGGEVLSADSY